MTDERWRQIKEIFHASLEREPGQRSAFLMEACANDEALRREVEALIAAHEKEGSFLDAPAYEVAASWLAGDAESLVGQHLDHYEILAAIGAGGMGEVYLAQDVKLGRKIALKLLPSSFMNDASRLRRFQQEARAASALNHPNILTIHEVGEQQGRPFIATELIEGETLRQRLAAGRLELSIALDIGAQIASALAAAHEVGIIHRDVKPENIMLRKDGYVKVLDFGLAKLTERKAAQSDPEAPTRVQGSTTPGMVMGTVNYMSPEQARGLSVDERTDIWSLGVVLYEMLVGRVPFEGETHADVTVSVLEREPASLTAVSKEIPAELDSIVQRALRKDREERYQTIKEMLAELRAVKQELEFEAKLERSVVPALNAGQVETTAKGSVSRDGSATTAKTVAIQTDEIKEAQPPKAVMVAGRRRLGRSLAITALASLVLAVAGFALYKFFFQDKRITPFQSVNFTRMTNHGKAISAAISPDGKYFVYVLSDAGKQSLWLRQTSAANDTQIIPPAPVGYFGVTFSRDGTEVYYIIKANDPGTLYRIPVLGGTPVKLLEKIDSPVSFSPDGKRMAFVRGDFPNRGESGLFIANADGSNVEQIAARKLPEFFFPIAFTGPSWSPDGQLVACAATNVRSEYRVVAVRLQDKAEQVLTTQAWPHISRVEWLPDMSGLLMVARDQGSTVYQIWHLSYPDGEVRKITNDLSIYRGLSLTADAGKLVVIQTSGIVNLWVVSGDDATQLPVGNLGFLGGSENVSWTPDGQIVFISSAGKQGDIWIVNGDGSNRRQLTSNAGNNHSPVVSPDGRHIVFTSDRSGLSNVWRMKLDGSDPQRLTSGQADFKPSVSPDGQWVIYSSLDSDRVKLWKVPMNGGAAVEVINRSAYSGVVSPDGKQIAYLFTEAASTDAPPNRIAVIPFEGGEPTKTFEIQSGLAGARTILQWSRDGRSLLYTAIANNISNIWSQSLEGGSPKQMTDFKEHLITAFDWSNDSGRLAVARGILIRDAVLISNSK